MKRDITFDIFRGLCMLWIVGVWHLSEYTSLGGRPFGSIGSYITICVLSSFTFMSGFFLGKKQTLNVSDFYINRFKRFYILFLLASGILFLGGWYVNISQFIYSIMGIGIFSPKQPGTIWYMSMLLFFYLITPAIINNKIKGYKKIISGVFFLAIFFMMEHYNYINHWCCFYFVFYLLGLLFPFNWYRWIVLHKYSIFALAVILLIVVLQTEKIFVNIFEYFKAIIGMVMLLLLSDMIKNICSKCLKMFTMLSYCSLCAYLFHRHIYKLLVLCTDEKQVSVTMAFVMLLSVLIISYYIQKSYDIMLDKAISRKKIKQRNG